MTDYRKNTDHDLIIGEMTNEYRQLIQKRNMSDAELEPHEQYLTSLATVPEVYLYYLSGILPLSLTKALLEVEDKIRAREDRQTITTKEILSELEVFSPAQAEQYRQLMSPQKVLAVRHLRQAATAYRCFFTAAADADNQLDLGKKSAYVPWVCLSDKATDTHLKLLNIIKILNFYGDGKPNPLLHRVTELSMDLMFDSYSCAIQDLNELAQDEKDPVSKDRMLAGADMVAGWLENSFDPMLPNDRCRYQAELYKRIRQVIHAFEKNPRVAHKKMMVFDSCMDLDDVYATKLKNYLVCQPIIKPKNQPQRLPLNVDRILQTHQSLGRDYFYRCDVENIHVTNAEKIIASFGAMDEDTLLYLCGFLKDSDYDRMIECVEILASDDFLNGSKEPIDVRRIFSFLLDKKGYALPLRKSYVDTVRDIKNAAQLVDYVCVKQPSKDNESVSDRLPNLWFVDRETSRLFKNAPLPVQRVVALKTLANVLPDQEQVRHNLNLLALDYFKKSLSPLLRVKPHPADPDLTKRTRLIAQIYGSYLPQGNTLTKCDVNKTIVQTEQLLHQHLEDTIGQVDQLWIDKEGHILRQSELTPKQAYLNGIYRHYRWADEWWHACQSAVREN